MLPCMVSVTRKCHDVVVAVPYGIGTVLSGSLCVNSLYSSYTFAPCLCALNRAHLYTVCQHLTYVCTRTEKYIFLFLKQLIKCKDDDDGQ